ncbi:hypothetical protein BKA81DRAFT_374339 [Phyllosticta paracitricarpa]
MRARSMMARCPLLLLPLPPLAVWARRLLTKSRSPGRRVRARGADYDSGGGGKAWPCFINSAVGIVPRPTWRATTTTIP